MTIGRTVCAQATRDKIWKSVSGPDVGEVLLDRSEQVFEVFESAFPEFMAAAGEVAPGDAETHLHLAEAYREMELFNDAVGEAGEALRLAKLAHDKSSIAVAILFDDRSLCVSVADALEIIREAHFQN